MTYLGKTVRLDEFLTAKEIHLCSQMYCEHTSTNYVKNVVEIVLSPVMERINKKLGQENDPMYLAYAIEYAMGRIFGKISKKGGE